MVDENYDIGGRGMLAGGRVQLGGGHALQQKLNIQDSPDQIFADWVRYDHAESRFSDRELIRVFADDNVAAWDFLIENGVEFIEKPIRSPDASTIDRIFVTKEWHIPSEIIAPRRNRNGSGLVRRLEQSARKKGAQIFLKHKMTSIVRERHNGGRVLGITTVNGSNAVNIQARKGIIIATGGHSGNVNFRRIFDPRLTEEYQQACEPYVHQGADGELAAMDIGASLWATAIQTIDAGAAITKTRHVGCRWGYSSLVYEPDSPMFPQARATGLTVKDWQNMIFVNQNGARFWNEVDGSHKFFAAAMAYNGDKAKLNGGGPVWAIFDADGVTRGEMEARAAARRPQRLFLQRRHDPGARHQDQESASEESDLRRCAAGDGQPLQYVRRRGRGSGLQEADADAQDRDAAVLCGVVDADPARHVDRPAHQHQFRGDRHPRRSHRGPLLRRQVQGGFAQHGLARCIVFGRIAGRHAAQRMDNGRRAARER